MRVKLLFLVSTLESGGPTNVILNIVKYLDRTLVEPEVLTLSVEPAKSSKADFERMGVPVHQMNQTRISWMLSGGGRLLRERIAALGPHIIHGHSLRPDVFLSKNPGGYVRFSTLHANLTANYVATYGMMVGKYFAWQHLNAARMLEQVVACSHSLFVLYRDEVNNLISIPNGTDTAHFHPAPAHEVGALRQSLGLPLDRKLFVSAGSLDSRKDPETVIKGFLKAEHADESVLVLLGTGPLEATLRQKYAADARVIFVGFTKAVAQYMQAADFFVSASTSEGLPNTVLEALACGLPVCLSEIPAHQEILSLNSNAGLMFACGDAAGLAEAMDAVLKGDYTGLRSAAADIIDTHLNARLMARKYQDLYVKYGSIK